jgi:hypothetical protein
LSHLQPVYFLFFFFSTLYSQSLTSQAFVHVPCAVYVPGIQWQKNPY